MRDRVLDHVVHRFRAADLRRLHDRGLADTRRACVVHPLARVRHTISRPLAWFGRELLIEDALLVGPLRNGEPRWRSPAPNHWREEGSFDFGAGHGFSTTGFSGF